MKTLEISPLTPENFRIFGSYSRLVEPTAPGGEGILSLDHDMYVYFAPAFYTAEQAGTHLVAFRVPAGVMLTIRPGVWHCMPFPVDSEVIHVLNVLPERTYANDVTMTRLKEEGRLRIREASQQREE